MTRLTGPALVAYLRDNPTSDAMRAAADEIERLRKALSTIAEWNPPKVLSQGKLVPMGVSIGSNGERDYFRGIARDALAQEQRGNDARRNPG